MSTTLLEDLVTCKHILQNIGQPHGFIIGVLDRVIKELTPKDELESSDFEYDKEKSSQWPD